MSKSKKRLIVRLLIVTVVVGLGVFAIVQAQRGALRSTNDSPSQTDSQSAPYVAPLTPIAVSPSVERYVPIQPPTSSYVATEYRPDNGAASPSPVPISETSSYGSTTPENTYGDAYSSGAQPSEHTNRASAVRPVSGTTELSSPPADPFGSQNRQVADNSYTTVPPASSLPASASISDNSAPSSNSTDFESDLRPGDNPATTLPTSQLEYQTQSYAPNDQTPPNTSPSQFESLPQRTTNATNLNPVLIEASSPAPNLYASGLNQPDVLPDANSINSLAGVSAGPAGVGAPGQSTLEGVQTPSLALEKQAPAEIQVGRPATFHIKIQNVGRVDATDVVVLDQVPRGTQFIDAQPPAEQAADGTLLWRLGPLKPGEETTISLQLLPLTEGEIGSVARVMFQAKVSARTVCTRPQLTVRHSAPPRVLIGQTISLSIEIANPGSGDAIGVILEENIPAVLAHPAGNELEFEIGVLKSGESRKIELTLTAERAGVVENVVMVRGEGNLIAEDRIQIEVIAPEIEVSMTGPSRRYLDRPATYQVSVSNPGTAMANDIELVAFLPKGMKYIQSNNNGQYDSQNHAVYWSLDELPPSVAGDVELTAVPLETGEQKLRIEGRADLGLSDSYEKSVLVEGLAELFFDVADTSDPIEIGSDTVYQIRVVNQGSKTATNVRLAAAMPQSMQPTGGDGPTRAMVSGQQIVFEPLARLAPNSEVVFKIQAQGLGEGDHRIRVQISCDEAPTPVVKEESTRVYSDR